MHGLYYLLMHGWFRVFAPTQLWARAPSALAIGGAAAGIVVLATQFGSRSVAVCSGVMFAVLPRASWAGVEARPYAMSTMAAVWITVLFAVALRRGRTVRWVCYAAAVALSIVLDVYLVLMVVAHLGFLVAVRARRAATIPFAVAGVAALAAPFMPFARRQSAQLGWIPPLSARTIIDVGVKQYFDRSVPFAILAALVVGTWIQLRRKDAKPGEPQIVWLTLTWVAIPTVLARLLGCGHADLLSALPVFHRACRRRASWDLHRGASPNAVLPRLFSSFSRWPPSRTTFTVSAARIPSTAWTTAKLQISSSRRPRAGDCLLLDDTVTWRPGPIRPLVAARPDAYAKLVDVGLGEPAASRNELWDVSIAPFVVADRIAQCRVLWIISERDTSLPDHQQGAALPPGPHFGDANAFWVPHDLGFRLVERWQFHYAQVIKETR